jgi:hypothetical protein
MCRQAGYGICGLTTALKYDKLTGLMQVKILYFYLRVVDGLLGWFPGSGPVGQGRTPVKGIKRV